MTVKNVGKLLLSGLLLAALTSCGGGEKTPAPAPEPEQPSVEVTAPVEPQPEPEPEPEPEPQFPYTNPLTGVGSETDIGKNRPIAIMLNNHKKALPQAGISQADVIYEIPAEGGITRMLALFQSVEGVGEIGTVRSARDYYIAMALGHDALYLHAGGSPQAYQAIADWNVAAFDCVNGPYEGTLFWRDKARWNKSGMEHSVMTSGETISELMPTYKYRLEHKDGYEVGWSFGELDAGGSSCNYVTVPYSEYKTGVFTYDKEKELYLVEEYGKAYIDANTQQQVGVKNVLVLYTDVSLIPGDAAGRLKVRTTGKGTGILARDGMSFTICWERKDNSAPLSFTYENGEEVTLGQGISYINILDSGRQVVLQ